MGHPRDGWGTWSIGELMKVERIFNPWNVLWFKVVVYSWNKWS